MTNNLFFEFNIDKSKHSVNVQREFAAELPLVWDAYTKPELLDQWWAPKPYKTETKRMDFREGGQWLYVMHGPNGEAHWGLTDYIKIMVHSYYTGLDGFCDENGIINKEMPRSNWKISFSTKAAHTLVNIAIQYPDLAQLETTIQMGFKEGLSMALGNLDDLLAKK